MDASRAGSMGREVRKAYADIGNEFPLHRFAIYGQGTFMRVVISFLMRVMGHSDMRMFATEEDALRWLRAERAILEGERG